MARSRKNALGLEAPRTLAALGTTTVHEDLDESVGTTVVHEELPEEAVERFLEPGPEPPGDVLDDVEAPASDGGTPEGAAPVLEVPPYLVGDPVWFWEPLPNGRAVPLMAFVGEDHGGGVVSLAVFRASGTGWALRTRRAWADRPTPGSWTFRDPKFLEGIVLRR